jgi:hypothetical protein
VSNVTCILSGTNIEEGDRVVAVLVTPRLHMPAMFQEYGPVSSFHAASAASFPILGTYTHYASFDPDEGQPATTFLKRAVGNDAWSDVLQILHEKGLGVEVDDVFPKRKIEQRPTAFAFVHESMYQAVIRTLDMSIDPTPAVDLVADLHRILTDGTAGRERDRAIYRAIELPNIGHVFGTDQFVSSISYDGIGQEMLAKHVERFSMEMMDGAKAGEAFEAEEARDLFGCVADITLFQNVLRYAGVLLQPSMSRTVVPEVRIRLASMTLERILTKRIEWDRDNGDPTPIVDEIREMTDRLEVLRVGVMEEFGI